MKRARSMVVLGALLLAVPGVQAQDEGEEVVARLKRHGGMSGGAANKLAKQVSKAMSRSADLTNAPNDPLRVRVSMALTGAPQPGDAMSTAKVRLRLYAGLTSWALDSLFRPEPGAIAACSRDFKLSTKDCTSLLAAGGQTSPAEVAAAASGAPSAPVAAAPAAAAPVAAVPSAAGGSRFGRFSSGYGGASRPVQQPAPTYAAASPTSAGRFGASPAAAPAARPTPVVAAAPQGSSTKDAYAARRAAYLEKQRARLNKPAPGAAAAEPAAATADAPEQAPEAVAAAPTATKPAAAAKAAAPAAEAPAEPAEPAAKPQLDNDFLDGLLEDPLGKK